CGLPRTNRGVLSFNSPYLQNRTRPLPPSTPTKCRRCEAASPGCETNPASATADTLLGSPAARNAVSGPERSLSTASNSSACAQEDSPPTRGLSNRALVGTLTPLSEKPVQSHFSTKQ